MTSTESTSRCEANGEGLLHVGRRRRSGSLLLRSPEQMPSLGANADIMTRIGPVPHEDVQEGSQTSRVAGERSGEPNSPSTVASANEPRDLIF